MASGRISEVASFTNSSAVKKGSDQCHSAVAFFILPRSPQKKVLERTFMEQSVVRGELCEVIDGKELEMRDGPRSTRCESWG
jgi:hypothetical protein